MSLPQTSPMSATEVLDREYLLVRCKMLEIAASLDRIDRAEGETAADPRTKQFAQAMRILQEESGDRAEQLQMLFSREYDDAWQETLNMPAGR